MEDDRKQFSRRALMLTAVAASLTGCGVGTRSQGRPEAPMPPPSTHSPTTTSSPPPPPPPPELPRGGRTIFPGNRLFGYCGSPAGKALGQLGVGDLDDEVTKMLGHLSDWADGEKVLPVMELIATIALAAPGIDGLYRGRIAGSEIETWLECARAHRTMLVLNVQPGRADFLDEAKHYERWLREPDVGLALDPEWAVRPGQVPGKVFGHTTGDKINQVARWLSEVVKQHDLPQKPLIYHVLRPSIVSDEDALIAHPGIALVKSVDGIGARADKQKTYRKVMDGTPAAVYAGFKLFFQEDAAQGPLMTPAQVLALTPRPDYVLYE